MTALTAEKLMSLEQYAAAKQGAAVSRMQRAPSRSSPGGNV
jgi:hypothetical protein